MKDLFTMAVNAALHAGLIDPALAAKYLLRHFLQRKLDTIGKTPLSVSELESFHLDSERIFEKLQQMIVQL